MVLQQVSFVERLSLSQRVPIVGSTVYLFSPSIRPKMAVVVVKKRINSRMFHEGRQGLANPPPGTIVDTVITKPEW